MMGINVCDCMESGEGVLGLAEGLLFVMKCSSKGLEQDLSSLVGVCAYQFS